MKELLNELNTIAARSLKDTTWRAANYHTIGTRMESDCVGVFTAATYDDTSETQEKVRKALVTSIGNAIAQISVLDGVRAGEKKTDPNQLSLFPEA